MPPRKQHFPDTAGNAHLNLQKLWPHAQDHTGSSQIGPSAERGKRAWIPPLTKKLTAIDSWL